MILATLTTDKAIRFLCPHCHENKSIPAARLKGEIRRLSVRCTCRNLLPVQVNWRRKARRPARLDGVYTGSANSLEGIKTWDDGIVTGLRKVNCRIRDLSIKGLGFEPLGHHCLTPGQCIHLLFLLDNSSRQAIQKKAVVRSVRPEFVGCEFVPAGDADDVTLGFYLL